MEQPPSFLGPSDADLLRARRLLRACACVLLLVSLLGIWRIHEACGAIEDALRPVLRSIEAGETRTLDIDASPILRFPGLSGGFRATIRGGGEADDARGIRFSRPELRLTHQNSDHAPVLPGDVASRYAAFLALACLAGIAEALARRPGVGPWRIVVFLSLVPFLLFLAPVVACALLFLV